MIYEYNFIHFSRRGFVIRFLKLLCKNFLACCRYLKFLSKVSHFKVFNTETLACLKNPKTFFLSVAEVLKQS